MLLVETKELHLNTRKCIAAKKEKETNFEVLKFFHRILEDLELDEPVNLILS